jgi:hypothetical protein
MTITTQKNAKKIPPRPKPKAKPSTKSKRKKSNTKTTLGNRKRAAPSDDESGQEDDEMSASDDSQSVRRAKRKDGKRQRVEPSDSEVEMVENGDKPRKDVEEVDAVGNEDDEQLVSPYHLPQALLTHHTLERWSQ